MRRDEKWRILYSRLHAKIRVQVIYWATWCRERMRLLFLPVLIRWKNLRSFWQTIIYIVVGLVILIYLASVGLHVFKDQGGFIANVLSEVIGILTTVFIVNQFVGLFAEKREKRSLTLQLGSPNGAIATEAARLLRERGWHDDGTLVGAQLTGADLHGAFLYAFDLRHAKLQGADLRNADLFQAHLDDAILDRANLRGADLSQACLDGAILDHANLAEAILKEASLKQASLGFAILDGAKLDRADIRGTDLSNISFIDATAADIIKDESQTLPIQRFQPLETSQDINIHFPISRVDSSDKRIPDQVSESASSQVISVITNSIDTLSTLDLDEFLKHILVSVSRIIPGEVHQPSESAKRCAYILIKEENPEFRIVSLYEDITAQLKLAYNKHESSAHDSDIPNVLENRAFLWRQSASGADVPKPVLEWARSGLIAPIRIGHVVIGCLHFVSALDHGFHTGDIELLEPFARLAATAVAKERFRRMTIELFKQTEKGALLDTIVKEATYFLQVTDGAFYEFRPEKDQLELVAAVGTIKTKKGLILKVGDGLAGYLVEQGLKSSDFKRKIIPNYKEWDGRSELFSEPRKYDAILGVLLRRRDNSIIGTFSLDTEVDRGWTEADAEIAISFAEYIELAYEQVDVIDRLQTTREAARFISELRIGENTVDGILLSIAQKIQSAITQDLVILFSYRNLDIDGRGDMQWVASDQSLDEISNGIVFQTQLLPVIDNLGSNRYTYEAIHKYDALDDVPSLPDDSHIRNYLKDRGIERVALVPLRTSKRYIGLLLVGAKSDQRHLDLNDHEGLKLLANQSATTIMNNWEFEENQQKVTHQLINSVSSLEKAIEILTSEDNPYPQNIRDDHSKKARKNICDLHKTIEFFLDTGPSATDLRKKTTAIDLNDIVQEIQKKMDDHALIKRINISVHLHSEPVKVDAVKFQLLQIIYNIVDNAIKFSHEDGNVRIIVNKDKDNGIIIVEDKGKGVLPEELELIYGKYFRGQATEEIPGYGLGLYHALNYVTMLGGRIEVISVPNSGSTFTVSIPISNKGIEDAKLE